MKIRSTLSCIALLCSSSLSMANVDFEGEISATDENGSPLPVGSTGVLVIDLFGDGFTPSVSEPFGDGLSVLNTSSLTKGNSIGGEDNIIIGSVDFASGIFNLEGLAVNLLDIDFSINGNSEIDVGDPLGFFFFDSVADQVSAGTPYGFFPATTSLAETGAVDQWFLPNSPGHSLFAKEGFVGIQADDVATKFTVAAVPEPGTLMALALAAFVPALLRMRRNARARDLN